jgi:hypothetical protein
MKAGSQRFFPFILDLTLEEARSIFIQGKSGSAYNFGKKDYLSATSKRNNSR